MIKRALTVAALSFFVATAAVAGTCPLMVQDIDNALATETSLSAEQVAEVKALRDQGEAEHEAGEHAASVATLQIAKEMLGLN